MLHHFWYIFSVEKTEINLTIEEIKEKIIPILERAGVIKSAIFGSAARGELIEDSDIDILVEFKEPVGFFSFCNLQNKLSDVLSREVDLLTFRSINPLLKDYIQRDAVQIL